MIIKNFFLTIQALKLIGITSVSLPTTEIMLIPNISSCVKCVNQTEDSPATPLMLAVSSDSSGSSRAAARSPGSVTSLSPAAAAVGLWGSALSLVDRLFTDMLSDIVVGLIGRSVSSCKQNHPISGVVYRYRQSHRFCERHF